jgi:NAD-dependent DNA ligase
MIRGVGPVYAKKLVRAFGEKVFDIVETSPDRLREVDGIGPVRAASILATWAEQKAVREIMVFLHSHGVSTARAVLIFKTYGADAIQVMTDNPYRLAQEAACRYRDFSSAKQCRPPKSRCCCSACNRGFGQLSRFTPRLTKRRAARSPLRPQGCSATGAPYISVHRKLLSGNIGRGRADWHLEGA